MSNFQKVIVGMSGGVDSSVAALLLQQQGYHVEGMFMKNWEDDDNDTHCSAETDLADVKAVCTRLGIPLHTINFAKQYWDKVFTYFLDGYRKGHTPNPDILCNQEIKFKAFLDHALSLGADFMATGHYVRSSEKNNYFHLYKSLDMSKDQSYFLYTLNQNQLSRSLFPIGKLQKKEVRKIAEQHGLINHAKKDSTGICFIGERKFKNFLKEYLLTQPGTIETPEGKTIGQHEGLMFYTIGQRQGLQIGGIKHAAELPWYVADKDIQRNVLIVVQGDHPLLFKKELVCENLFWIAGGAPNFPYSCAAKIRYRQIEQACIITQKNSQELVVTFEEAQRAVTPGQSVVFYKDDECLGGGIIK